MTLSPILLTKTEKEDQDSVLDWAALDGHSVRQSFIMSSK